MESDLQKASEVLRHAREWLLHPKEALHQILLEKQLPHHQVFRAIDKYLNVMWQVTDGIENGKSQDVVADVGKIIQYWAVAHPFPGVNHSLIMNFANYLLEKHGFNTVPAPMGLWTTAVCLPNTFPQYFKHYYDKTGVAHKPVHKSLGWDLTISDQHFIKIPIDSE